SIDAVDVRPRAPLHANVGIKDNNRASPIALRSRANIPQTSHDSDVFSLLRDHKPPVISSERNTNNLNNEANVANRQSNTLASDNRVYTDRSKLLINLEANRDDVNDDDDSSETAVIARYRNDIVLNLIKFNIINLIYSYLFHYFLFIDGVDVKVKELVDLVLLLMMRVNECKFNNDN